MRTSIRSLQLLAACGLALLTITATAQQSPSSPPAPPTEEVASSSLMATTPLVVPADQANDPHALRAASMFAITPPKPRKYEVHDLVQIIVRESSQAKSMQELETKKKSKLDGRVSAWPDLNLSDLLQLRIEAGRTNNLPQVGLDFTKDFKGDADYQRRDDLSARLTAKIIEVQPNGNLVLEARTNIRTDQEEQTMLVTGVCRPQDVTAANTVLSNQIYDLSIEKIHKGELKRTAEKGIIARVLETVFAF